MKISFACKQGKKSAQSRSVAAILIVIMLLSFMSPAVTTATAENTPKQEVVYANLEADGKVSKLYVVNVFELDDGGQVTDYGDYRSVKNLTSEEEIELRDGTVKVEAKPGRLYYEGTLAESAIPWNFEVHYSLDGIEYAPAELAGRSGALKIWTYPYGRTTPVMTCSLITMHFRRLSRWTLTGARTSLQKGPRKPIWAGKNS